MSETAADRTEADDRAYFQAIEECFVGLRGAPLLLSPADYQVARRWRREGVPLDLVRRVLAELFSRRREQGAKGRINSLRYCAPAVAAAWQEVRALTAPGHRGEPAPIEAAPRLAALAAALPTDLPGRDRLAQAILDLGGGTEAVEVELAQLDAAFLAEVEAGLDGETRAALGSSVDRTLAHLADRLGAAELEEARARLHRQALRRRLRLPVLSLFAPEAEPREPGGSPDRIQPP